jgi:oxygen-independent coproporphyrinogen-3 oxidase
MNLLQKYNIPGPRYTSYPTVPYWDKEAPTEDQWKESLKFGFGASHHRDGISLYIHLPFCESLCTYCGCNTRITVNHSVESPYIIALLKEWSMYLDLFEETPRIREIHLGGGTPTFFAPQHLAQLLEGIISSSVICPDAEFGFEAHPNSTSVEHLRTLYDIGFRRLSLGIQDFDPVVQHIVNRVQSFEQVKEVTEQARTIGYTSINYDLIYGLPMQTLSSVLNTIELVSTLRPDRIAFYSYAHVPWIKPGQRKFTELDLPLDTEKRRLYESGREKLIARGYEEIGMDHFALPTDSLYKAMVNKELHRNFMGYTHRYTPLLLGLGVSSISETEHSYGQNVKKVEEYYEKINSGHLPVVKGHMHTLTDCILKKHILNIICKMETSWLNPSEQCQEVYDALHRLKEMELDGLVVVDGYHLRVTEAGKPFIRNVCMAFDARLWSNVPKTEIFSSTI